MSSRAEKYEAYLVRWSLKKPAAIRKELESYQRHLSRHADTFFQQSAPDELSDGDRVSALRDALRIAENGPGKIVGLLK